MLPFPWNMQKLFKHQDVLLALLSGFFIGTSFIPFPPWAACFGFVPLWLTALRTHSVRRTFFLGWITQFVLTLIGFNWVAYTAHEFGRLPWIFSIFVLAAFCSFANIYVPLGLAFWQWLRGQFKLHPSAVLMLLPTCTFLAEQNIPTIFDWNFGYTWFASQLPIYHLAEFIGFAGISSLVIAINLFFLLAINNSKNRTRLLSWLCAGLAAIVALNLLGLWISHQLRPEDKVARVLITQANIGNLEKVYAFKKGLYRDHIVDEFLRLSESKLNSETSKVDFMVWPETAFPDEIPMQGHRSYLFYKVVNFLQNKQIPLITGAYGVPADTERIANSVFFIPQDGTLSVPPYHKTHLLAFGEFFPMGDTFPWLRRIVPNMGNFARGHGPTVSMFSGIKIGAQVCYESLFPYFSNELKIKGSQIIVNVTNDSWFGKHQEPFQHMYMTLARAVENRIPLIRSTNTGISTAVTSSGKVLELSPLHEKWSGVFEVPYSSHPKLTFFNRFFYLIPALWIALFALLIISPRVTRKK